MIENIQGGHSASGVNRLINQLKSSQRELWLQGKHEPAEDILERHPELASAPEAFSLVYSEFLLREEVGNPPRLVEFQERFPRFAQQLADQIKLHDVFGNTAWRLSTDADQQQTWQAPCPTPDIPGFEDFTLLGRGGMGLVYRARQVKLDRLVAVKMMIGGLYAGPDSLIRFRTEAEAVAYLDHPNIVPIYEVGEWHGLLYFTMKLIDCGPLSQHLVNYRKNRKSAARLVADIARALHYAHQRGILHRDLKPSNILIDKEGKPYVTDFGLAKRVDRNEGLTGTGCVGTPGYLAPEQASGAHAPTVALDVWGLGTILYELLTQKAPYSTDTPMKAMQEVLDHDPRRPRSIDSSINADLETICLKSLAREPERRYTSALAMAEDLERWENGEPIHARTARPAERLWRWVKRRPAVAGLLVAFLVTALAGVAGITAAWLYALSGWNRADELGQQAETEKGRAERRRDEAETHLYFSRIAQASHEEKSNNPASAQQLLDLCQPADEDEPDRRNWEWRYLQGLLHSDILTIPQPHEEITFDVSFSQDGQRLVTAGGSPYRPYPADRVRVWQVWGEAAGKQLAEFSHSRFLQQARFLGNSHRIAWFGDDKQLLGTGDTVTGTLPSVPLPPQTHAMALSQDGSRYVVGDNKGNYQVYDLVSRQRLGEWKLSLTTTSGLSFNQDATVLAVTTKDGIQLRGVQSPYSLHVETIGNGRSRVSFSSDGKWMALGMTGGVVKIWDTEKGQLLQSLTGHDGDVRAVAFSPNGQHLATTGADHTVRLWSIKSGEEVLRFRGHQGRGMCLSFHPSGRFLASGAGQPSEVKIWDLTRHQEYLNVRTVGARRIEAMAFSSDGNVLHTLRAGGSHQKIDAFTGVEQGIATVDLTTKPIRPAVIATFSTDGLLATVTAEDTRTVNITTSEGKMTHRLIHQNEVAHLAFSKDGKRLVSSSPAQKKEQSREITVWNVETGQVVKNVTCDAFVDDRVYGPVAINSDGSLIAHEEYPVAPVKGSLERICEVVVRNATTGELVFRLPGTLPRVERMAFNEDGSLLALSCDKIGVILYNLSEKKWLHRQPLQGSSNRTSLETFWDMSFSPDGKRLAAVNRVHVLLWDIATGKMVLTLRGAAPPAGDNGFNPRVVWSRDGRRLAASNSDTSLSIWDSGERQSSTAKQSMSEAAMKRAVGQ